MKNSFLHRTCGPVRGTWDLGRPRPAGPHPTPDADPGLSLSHGGSAIPDRLPYSRLSIHTSPVIQFSADYTNLVWHHYNSQRVIECFPSRTILGRLYIQRLTCHTMLVWPCNSLPARQIYTGEAVSREPVSHNVPRARAPRANAPSANVQRGNAWNNCVTYIIPPTGHLKLHTNYIYQTSKLHTNYIYRSDLYM